LFDNDDEGLEVSDVVADVVVVVNVSFFDVLLLLLSPISTVVLLLEDLFGVGGACSL
jgi:hypothetical protein